MACSVVSRHHGVDDRGGHQAGIEGLPHGGGEGLDEVEVARQGTGPAADDPGVPLVEETSKPHIGQVRTVYVGKDPDAVGAVPNLHQENWSKGACHTLCDFVLCGHF